jgi:hypothetical protein
MQKKKKEKEKETSHEFMFWKPVLNPSYTLKCHPQRG